MIGDYNDENWRCEAVNDPKRTLVASAYGLSEKEIELIEKEIELIEKDHL